MDVVKALEDVREGRLSITKAAALYHIPKTTLHGKLSVKYDSAQVGRKSVLSYDEERDLANWAIKMSKIGYGRVKHQIFDKVRDMVQREGRITPFKDNKPGKEWFRGFLKRNPDVKLRTAEPLHISRATACTPTAINRWFQGYQKFMSGLGMLDHGGDRVWNADESGFCLSPKTGKVLASRKQKNVMQIAGDTRTQITVLCAVSASGSAIPPFQIFSGTRLTHNPLEDGVEGSRFALSKSGWMTSEVFQGWIKNHFLKCIPPARPVVLLLDGHSSHVNLDTSRLCEENGIELYCLPPHSSHILQPLDVSVFKAMKCNWTKAVQQYQTETGKFVDKKTFSRVFRGCWENTISTATIIHGFRASGVFPVNRLAIDETKLLPSELFDDDQEVETAPNNEFDKMKQSIKNLEEALGEKKIREFRLMEEEGFDIAEPLFDAWKTLKNYFAAMKAPISDKSSELGFTSTLASVNDFFHSPREDFETFENSGQNSAFPTVPHNQVTNRPVRSTPPSSTSKTCNAEATATSKKSTLNVSDQTSNFTSAARGFVSPGISIPTSTIRKRSFAVPYSKTKVPVAALIKPPPSATLSKPPPSAALSKPPPPAALSKPPPSAALSKPPQSATLSKPSQSATLSKPPQSATLSKPPPSPTQRNSQPSFNFTAALNLSTHSSSVLISKPTSSESATNCPSTSIASNFAIATPAFRGILSYPAHKRVEKRKRNQMVIPQHLTGPEFISLMATKREENEKKEIEKIEKKQKREEERVKLQNEKEERKRAKLEKKATVTANKAAAKEKILAKKATKTKKFRPDKKTVCQSCDTRWENREANEVWVCCSVCKNWYCFKCCNLSEAKKELACTGGYKHRCDNCLFSTLL